MSVLVTESVLELSVLVTESVLELSVLVTESVLELSVLVTESVLERLSVLVTDTSGADGTATVKKLLVGWALEPEQLYSAQL